MKEFKTKAKIIMLESQPRQLTVSAVYVLLSLLFSYLVYRLSGYGTSEFYSRMLSYSSSGNIDAAAEYLMSIDPSFFNKAVIIALICLRVLIDAGFSVFIINSVRKTEPTMLNLLDGFHFAPKLILFTIIRYAMLFVGSVLFVVPAVLFYYFYRMAIFIMIDNPELSVFKAMKQSRQLLKGHKAELFRLDMSFFFWLVLRFFSYVGTVSQFISLPWCRSSYVLFYDNLTGRTPISSVPDKPVVQRQE